MGDTGSSSRNDFSFLFCISDTSYFAKGYTKTEDLAPVAISGKYSDLINIPDTLSAELFIGSASGLTGILADSVGVLSGNSPLVLRERFMIIIRYP